MVGTLLQQHHAFTLLYSVPSLYTELILTLLYTIQKTKQEQTKQNKKDVLNLPFLQVNLWQSVQLTSFHS